MKWLLVFGLSILLVSGAYLLGRQSASQSIDVGSATLDSLELAMREPSRVEGRYSFAAYMNGLNADNLEQTLKVIESSGRRLSSFELELLMLAWCKFDPAGAFERALLDTTRDGRRAVGAATYAWATYDPVAARSALLGLGGDRLEDFLLGRFLAGWVDGGGLAGATEFARETPPGPGRQFLTGVIATQLSERSAADAIAWAEAAPAGDGFKKLAFNKTTAALSRTAPAAAAAWLERHVDAPYADGCTWVLAWNWVESAPKPTFEWLATLPPGARRAEAVRKAFAYWREADAEAAEDWLGAQSPSMTLDPAIHIVVAEQLEESPAAAINWTRRIYDKGRRERMMVKVGKIWMREDPEAAKQWLSTSGLPLGARRAILEQSS